MSDTTVVQLQRVTKRYAGHTAVRELSLVVPRGSIYGLLGPNGAGKTTTIRMMMNVTVPDEGSIQILGAAAGRELSHRVGYLPEERGLYKKMKVLDVLMFLAEAKGVRRADARRDARAWLAKLGLGDWEQKKVDDLSKGMQQKVQFVSAILHRPELLILDEPFSGLDPVNSQLMKDTVVELARSGCTVMFSTHIMEQAEKLCDALCIIARGEKVLDGRLSEIKRTHGGRHVMLSVEQWLPAMDAVVGDRTLVAKANNYGLYSELELASGADSQQLLQRAMQTGAKITRFEITEASLTKIFMDIVGPEAATAPAAVEVRSA
jgi:ABC-2 type transport system ATP-binding protein